jgi:hypothetical protein
VKRYLDELTVYTQATFLGVFISGLLSSSIFDSSMQGMWSLFNQYQLLLLFPFLDTYLFPEFLYFITQFNMFKFDLSFLEIDDLPYLDKSKHVFYVEQRNKVFKDNDYESGSFAINQSEIFFTVTVLIMLSGVLSLIKM